MALALVGCGSNPSQVNPKKVKIVPMPPCLASAFRVGHGGFRQPMVAGAVPMLPGDDGKCGGQISHPWGVTMRLGLQFFSNLLKYMDIFDTNK